MPEPLTWASVNVRRISAAEPHDVLAIRPAPNQTHLVTGVEKSLAEIGADEALTGFAVYDGSQRGLPQPEWPPIGFAVTEVTAGVGFILRVLIDADQQRRGYGRATRWATPFAPPDGEVYLCLPA